MIQICFLPSIDIVPIFSFSTTDVFFFAGTDGFSFP